MKTRSRPSAAAAVSDKLLELYDDFEPPKLLILPQAISKQACVITLTHPRNATPTRYCHCPETGLYEFTKIASPKAAYNSLLITPGPTSVDREHIAVSQYQQISTEDRKSNRLINANKTEQLNLSNGYVSKSADFFVSTPFDPLFLLLPVLYADSSNKKSSKARTLFQPADDIFEELSTISKHFVKLFDDVKTRMVLEDRMKVVCDTVNAADEILYRLNIGKLLQELLDKAKRMVSSGLPPSMEEKFVRNALEVPVLCVRRQDTSTSEVLPDEIPTKLPNSEANDSQNSTLTTPSESSATTDITSPDVESQSTAFVEISSFLRLKTALDYLLSSYLPLSLTAELNSYLASSDSPFDFSPLTKHLSHLTSLRAEAIAARSLASASMKRNLGDDDEAVETRVEKKRKKEEDEKRKKLGESKGVRDLKKVDTKGMRKLNDFFGGKKGK
ncbi:hypothetical protein MMC14_004160 [Varicellaria rhodocarpa]|nr:hypothetical protein [Varicellaria rhodocarpa]